MEYMTLTPIHDQDTESSTLILDHLTTRETTEWYLPTPFLPLLLHALEEKEDKPLIAWVHLIEHWLASCDPQLVFIGVTCMEKNQGIRIQHTWQENAHELEAIQVSGWCADSPETPYRGSMYPVRDIAISSYAQFMAQPGNLDALGDEVFGEHQWQTVKEWLHLK